MFLYCKYNNLPPRSPLQSNRNHPPHYSHTHRLVPRQIAKGSQKLDEQNPLLPPQYHLRDNRAWREIRDAWADGDNSKNTPLMQDGGLCILEVNRAGKPFRSVSTTFSNCYHKSGVRIFPYINNSGFSGGIYV